MTDVYMNMDITASVHDDVDIEEYFDEIKEKIEELLQSIVPVSYLECNITSVNTFDGYEEDEEE